MPFHFNLSLLSHHRVVYQDKKPLQISKPNNLSIFSYLKNERVYVIASQTAAKKGSATIEFLLIFPIVMYLFVAIFQVYEMYMLEMKLENAMTIVGNELGQTQYFRERAAELGSDVLGLVESDDKREVKSILKNTISSVYVREQLKSQLEDTFRSDMVVTAKTDAEAGYLELQVDYTLKFTIVPGVTMKFYRTQWQRHGLWAGKTLQSNTMTVYVTTNGTVYHKKQDCTYLKTSFQKIAFAQINTYRNASGSKYKQCSTCKNGIYSGDYVYITKQGTKYHFTDSCSALKRSVIAVDYSKVSYMSACKRCGGS
jgi:hypothetical protein